MRMSHDLCMMMHAWVASQMSTCNRLQVGAVLAVGDEILSTGRNGAPRGLPHCTCGPEAPCTVAVHAEMNALIFAGRNGRVTAGSTLYITHSPCEACAGPLINAGVARVVYDRQYRLLTGIELLRRGGIEIAQVDGRNRPARRAS